MNDHCGHFYGRRGGATMAYSMQKLRNTRFAVRRRIGRRPRPENIDFVPRWPRRRKTPAARSRSRSSAGLASSPISASEALSAFSLTPPSPSATMATRSLRTASAAITPDDHGQTRESVSVEVRVSGAYCNAPIVVTRSCRWRLGLHRRLTQSGAGVRRGVKPDRARDPRGVRMVP